MANPPDRITPGLMLALDDIVGPVPGFPEWNMRALFVTDMKSSYLRLRMLTIEPANDAADPHLHLTTDVLKAVRVSGLTRVAEEVLRHRADVRPERPPSIGHKPGRPRDTWTPVELAKLAKRYAELAGKPGADIYGALAQEWRTPKGETVTDASLRTAVKMARSHQFGYLTETKPGVPGGKLTDEAKKILRRKGRTDND